MTLLRKKGYAIGKMKALKQQNISNDTVIRIRKCNLYLIRYRWRLINRELWDRVFNKTVDTYDVLECDVSKRIGPEYVCV